MLRDPSTTGPYPAASVTLRHVGINLLYLVPGHVGGTEIYARQLVRALALQRPEATFSVFCGQEAAPSLRDAGWPGNVALHVLPVRSAIKPARVAAEQTLLPLASRRSRVELMHSLGTTTPVYGCGVRVVTVHDLIYDLYPDSFPWTARYGLKAIVPLGARRAHRVQVDSGAAGEVVRERLRVSADKIDVVHLGVGMPPHATPTPPEALRSRWELGAGPVVLSVAAALPHKNLDRLLRAFATVLEPPATLVMVGHAGRQSRQLESLAAELGVADRVRFTGWIADEDVEGFYRLASAFVYPSLHEGFGMPVLEAMRRGVPTACADATSLPEVAGDAALLFDPLSVEDIAGAIRTLLTDPSRAAEHARRGARRAGEFEWDRTARAAWQSYERALGAAGTAHRAPACSR